MTTDRLDLASPDLVTENIDKIALLFPHCVTETDKGKAIDFDLLKQELNHQTVEGNKERYRLEWPGKREAIVTANMPTTNTLRPVREDSVDFDNTENLYIEGDNLEVLKLLQESYLGKIKMIYIDPPYNTGNDFVYKDKFTQKTEDFKQESGLVDEYNQRLVPNPETAGRYHSDWLSMMYPRLKLARNLLTDDGVIFISIDDNEVHNLRKMCDEIFGEGNFMSQIIIQSNKRGQTYKEIAKTHEYLLLYTKNDFYEMYELEKDNDSLPYTDTDGKYDLWELRNRNPKFGRFNRKNLYYPFYISPSSLNEDSLAKISLQKTEEFNIEVFPQNSEGIDGCWRWEEKKVTKTLNESESLNSPYSVLVARQKKDGDWNIYQKSRKNTTKAKSLWNDNEVISEQGTVELGKIGFKNMFDHPKPVSLVKRAVQIGTFDNDIILDFFSGSATTAHAIMQLNAEGGRGMRKFILVQVPEATDSKSEAHKAGYANICEIGKERIRRAGKKINEERAENQKKKDSEIKFEDEIIHPLDTGFRVYRLDSSNMEEVYYKPDEYKQEALDLFADNIKPDRSPEDLLTQIMLDMGLPLSLKIEEIKILEKAVYKVSENALFVCFDTDIESDFAREIAKEKPERIVFRDSTFKDDTAKENVKQLLKQLSPDTQMRII